jgi:hypothetical protein
MPDKRPGDGHPWNWLRHYTRSVGLKTTFYFGTFGIFFKWHLKGHLGGHILPSCAYATEKQKAKHLSSSNPTHLWRTCITTQLYDFEIPNSPTSTKLQLISYNWSKLFTWYVTYVIKVVACHGIATLGAENGVAHRLSKLRLFSTKTTLIWLRI